MRWCGLLLFACSSSNAPAPVVVPPRPPDADAAIDAASDAAVDAASDTFAIDPVLREHGAKLFEDKGCIACHSLDGTFRLGPNLVGDWGSKVTLDDGSEVVVDEPYLRESILDSMVKKRAGFAPVMPAFVDRISPEELDALVAFIRSLR